MPITHTIAESWFFKTNLSDYTELQTTLASGDPTKLKQSSQILAGKPGIGKTYNSILLARDFMVKRIQEIGTWHYSFEPVFIEFMNLSNMMIHDMQFGSDEKKSQAFYKLKEIKESPFIIIDDLRCTFSSEYQKIQLDSHLLNLLSEIYSQRKNKILIITTNHTEQEIRKAYSNAVCSRLFGMCKYQELNGQDRRVTVDSKL